MLKEKGGTSHINQAYDQSQAKADKRAARQLLELARQRVKGNIDQWNLCGILCVAHNNLPDDIWIKSFKTVNLHPDYRIPFHRTYLSLAFWQVFAGKLAREYGLTPWQHLNLHARYLLLHPLFALAVLFLRNKGVLPHYL